MLLRIRQATAGKFSYFIVGLITVPLALWGISYYFQGAFDPVVIEIDSVEVTLSEFNQEFNQRKRDLAARVDASQMPPDDAIKQEVVSHFVRGGVEAYNADVYRYRIPDSVLAENILGMSEFWVDNRFDKELYTSALKARRISQSGFEENIRNTLRKGKLHSVIEESSFVLPYEDAVYEGFLFEERQGRYVGLPIEDYMVFGSVPTTRAETYYVDNEKRFVTADRFALEYIELNVEEIAAGLVIEAEEAEAYYDRNVELFSAPQRRILAHILVDPGRHGESGAEERAGEIHAKLQQGEDFSELARSYSDDAFTAEKGGGLPPLARDDLDEEIAEVVFALDVGDFTEPIKSPFGVQIFKLIEVEPVLSRSFEEASGEIYMRLKLDLAEQVYGEAVEQLQLLAYEYPDGLDQVASQVGTGTVVVKSASPLDIRKREGPFQYPEIRSVVYTDQVFEFEENSEVVEIGDGGHAFVVRIAEGGYEAGRQMDFAEVEDEIVEILRKEDAWKAAGVAVEAILKRLQAKDTTLDELAHEHAWTIKDIDFVRRDDQELYPGLVRALFLMPSQAGGHTIGLASDTAYAVIELLKVRLGEFLPEEKQELDRSRDEYWSVLSAILENTPVEIDSEEILGD